jgi:hypothetical protein
MRDDRSGAADNRDTVADNASSAKIMNGRARMPRPLGQPDYRPTLGASVVKSGFPDQPCQRRATTDDESGEGASA